MESKTYIKDLKISPRKLRFLLPGIKKLGPAKAMDFLNYTPNKGARMFYQAIKSAITSAKMVLKTTDNMLKFRVLTVEEGQKLRRFNPGGRGTAKPYVKRSSHIRIVLTARRASDSMTGLVQPVKADTVKTVVKPIEKKVIKNVKKTAKKKAVKQIK